MKRLSTATLTAALVLAACSGDGDSQASDIPEGITRAVASAPATTTTTTVQTAPTTTVLAPSALAFTSSDDIGRLFSIDSAVTASTSAGGSPDATAVTAGQIVQASSLRDVDGVLWVRAESTSLEGGTLGWVPSTLLSPTSDPVIFTDDATSREFRQVSRSVPDDRLLVFASPGVGSPIASIPEGSVAMHGGVTALAPSGVRWLNVIDPATSAPLGWVEARPFGSVTSGILLDETGATLERDPVDGVSYGQALVGGISSTGCNAIQVRFANASSADGIGVVFGVDSPIGRELSGGRFQWSGTSAFSGPGADIIITIPAAEARTWFFAPLDSDGNATFSSRNENDRAIADNVLQIEAPATRCAPAPVISNGGSSTGESGEPVIDPYVADLLTEEERLEAIAQFEASSGGATAPAGEENEEAADAATDGDDTADAATDGDDAVDAATDGDETVDAAADGEEVADAAADGEEVADAVTDGVEGVEPADG